MNIEHRTLNIERRMMRSLRSAILLIDRMPYSSFDVGRSMLDVHLFHQCCLAEMQPADVYASPYPLEPSRRPP